MILALRRAPRWTLAGTIWFLLTLVAAVCGSPATHIQGADKAATAAKIEIPPAANRPVDFHREVLPILARHCARCHTAGKNEGGLAMDDRARLLKGGETGPALVLGQSGISLMIQLAAGQDPDRIMPAQGRRLTADEIGILRAWIDQGTMWEAGLTLSSFPTARWEPRHIAPPPATAENENPIDRILAPYFAHQKIVPGPPVSDRVFARRVWLDLVGLLPRPQDITALEQDKSPDKRAQIAKKLLAARGQYATHWLSFWNDALRNDYKGTGYIDGGRKQITPWLYTSLAENKPYDRFARELIAPTADSEGFIKGIVWRGVVNASQRPEMQAAQNVSQVFLGINMKCASCHDSFVSQWKLNDAYALAGVFADAPLEVHRCDTPTGKHVEPRFLVDNLGKVDAKSSRDERRRQVALALTSREDGRFARTIVNRLWARLMGRGLVEPVDAMDNPPWNADLLDFLAEDLVAHDYDLQATLALIVSSRAYQMPSVGAPPATEKDYVFRGPLVRRLNAEQFIDGVSQITGVWQPNAAFNPAKKGPAKAAPADKGGGESPDFSEVGIRSALALATPLARALGRPGREQVVTNRDSAATTLEALEMTNGTSLDALLKQGADRWLAQSKGSPDELVKSLYLRTFDREPLPKETELARQLLGTPATRDGVQDLIWTLVMLPEFQLIQ